MKEYIVSIQDDERDFEEVFVGYIRKQKELVRCKDCKHSKPIDSEWLECQHDKRVMKENGFCSWAEPKDSTAEVRRQLKEQEQRKEMERKK